MTRSLLFHFHYLFLYFCCLYKRWLPSIQLFFIFILFRIVISNFLKTLKAQQKSIISHHSITTRINLLTILKVSHKLLLRIMEKNSSCLNLTKVVMILKRSLIGRKRMNEIFKRRQY